MSQRNTPRVSILVLSKNSARTIRRCLTSLCAQGYANLEIVILDGQSSDDTHKIIREFDSAKIKLVVEPPLGHNHALFRGIELCKGDIITMCWADEELTPGAVFWGVGTLTNHPELAGIYGDVYMTDEDGKLLHYDILGKGQPFDMGKFLCWEMIPNYCGSFFWREALERGGFFDVDYKQDLVMFEYYWRTALKDPIKYIPGCVGKFSTGGHSSTRQGLLDLVKYGIGSIQRSFAAGRIPRGYRTWQLKAETGLRMAIIPGLVVSLGDVESAAQIASEALKSKEGIARLMPVLGQMLGCNTTSASTKQVQAVLERAQELLYFSLGETPPERTSLTTAMEYKIAQPQINARLNTAGARQNNATDLILK